MAEPNLPTADAITAFDAHMMANALGMAARGLGQTAPNPSVGCVIADPATGEVIARATTAAGGRPHAETVALAAAGARARGATIYVTLEPCSHVGKTGPCADAIVAAGCARAVVAIEDPDPRVAGRGLDRLRQAGIEVVRGVGAAEARWLTRGHIVRVTERRPLVTLKMALDGAGNIARGVGAAPVFVTGPLARAHGHLLRAQHDAILVGAGTLRDDNPELTCRLPGLLHRSPVRVVLAQDLAAVVNSRMYDTKAIAPVWTVMWCVGDFADPVDLTPQATHVFTVPEVNGRAWLPAVMEKLVAHGITRLLVEGGPTVWRSFADAALIDEIVLYMAGRADEAAVRAVLGKRLGAQPLTLVERRQLDADTLWRFRRLQHNEGPKQCSPA